MIVKSVRLTNFRCKDNYLFECKNETELILGKNGCGKTSILEAIYIATQGKSFRATDPEIMKHGADYYRIVLKYEDGIETIVTYDGNDKIFLTGDKKSKRLPIKYKYPVVLFLPDDLHIFETSPTKKRDFFDRIISGCFPEYSLILSRYNKALRQRNIILKDSEVVDSELLFSWNIMLAKYGTEIRDYRKKIVEKINEKITEVYRSIAKNEDEISIRIKSFGPEKTENSYFLRLENDLEKDVMLGHTTYGVHRDDFEFIFNEKDASGSASRGESRSIILALKFIEANMIYEKTHKKPIVLLDDVFSELDDVRQKALTENFKDNQVIITSVAGI